MLPLDVVSDLKTHTQTLEHFNDITIPGQVQAPFDGVKLGPFGGVSHYLRNILRSATPPGFGKTPAGLRILVNPVRGDSRQDNDRPDYPLHPCLWIRLNINYRGVSY